MISIAPPGHWTARFDCDPQTFIEAASATDYASEFLTALTAAVVRHPDREWIDALSAAWLADKNDIALVSQSLSTLLMAASADHRPLLMESQLRELGAKRFDVSFAILQMLDLQWSPPVTAFALDNLTAAVRSERQQWSHARNTLDAWAQRCDLGVASSQMPALSSACGDGSPWRNALEQMNDIVEFRLAMTKELRRDG